ncbi:carbon-nitrogen hydrolase [Pisolithus marmoratus]|nr:carbon-nitrogen hydrolase [Pisolithus marmoratus]
MAATTTLRAGVVQFAPKIGRVHANIAKARELCKGLTPRCVDLLCFPEMIFSGYMFPSAASISPYLEHARTGPTCTFCTELARRLECYVTAGFPEPTPASPPHNHTAGAHLPPTIVGFNTAVLYSPTGELLTLYRKSNLYETDLNWAAPGNGFTVLDLPPPLGKTTIAICNDLNVHMPAVWESLEDGPYELARYCMREGTRLLVLLNAWLKAGDEDDEDKDDGEAESTEERKACNVDDDDDGLEPNWETLNWWAQRLRPTWAHHYPTTENEDEDQHIEHQINGSEPRDLVVVACNRFGDEGERTFVGSSAMLMMRRGSGRPRLLHAMGEREEGIGIWTVSVRP